MSANTQRDPFVPRLETSRSIRVPELELEAAWFDAPRRSSRPPSVSTRSAAPPIDDPIADDWFR